MYNHMHINEVSKVYIIGSVASGKTTMARRMSKNLNIPWYELDNVVHIRSKKFRISQDFK